MKDQNGQKFSFTKREIIPLIIFIFSIGGAWTAQTIRTNALANDSVEVKEDVEINREDITQVKQDVAVIKDNVVDIKEEQVRQQQTDLEQTQLLYKILGALEKNE